MMTELERALELYVKAQLGGYKPRAAPGRHKIIHDPLWGTLSLSAAEVDILDCPLLQRLRFIHQTGLAFFTFPSARHSRLEHSIGVMAMATKMASALNENEAPPETLVNPRQMQELRIAALLHDIGHGFFSHISEVMYGSHKWITDIRRQPQFAHAKPHEILSSLVVRSPVFEEFFKSLQQKHWKHARDFASIKLENVALLILGIYPEDDGAYMYLGDIINGPFDADKLDYIARDAYFTGLTLSVDIERLLYKLAVRPVEEDETPVGTARRRLVATLAGSTALEQVVISKLRLYEVLYHHPKVRAADRMMGSIGEYMAAHQGALSQQPQTVGHPDTNDVIRLENPTSYLKHPDGDFLCLARHQDNNLRQMIDSIRKRCLPVKALVISRRTVLKRDMLRIMLSRWSFTSEARQMLKLLAKKIYDDIPATDQEGYIADHIIVDLPEMPQLTEAPLMKVIRHDEHGNEKLESLNEETRVHDWCSTAMINKWRGHVFSPPALQRAASEAAIRVFKGYGFEFHPSARILANIRD